MKVAIIGMGHFGPNYYRTFKQRGFDVSVCDSVRDLSQYPVDTYKDWKEAVKASEVVVVATPTTTHFDITQYALLMGKHVLCEKPLTMKPMEHFHLTHNARENNLILFPALTFLFNPAVRLIQQHFFDEADYGECVYIRTERVNAGPVRQDVHAIADLAVHDISILNYFLGDPKYVNSGLIKRPDEQQPGSGYINLDFKGIKTSSFVSWNEPVKGRLIRMVFEGGTVDFDDTKLKPIQSYNGGSLNNYTPEISPLDLLVNEFIDCIQNKECEFGLKNLQHISENVTNIIAMC